MTQSNGWPVVPLGKLLKRNDRVVSIDPANEYKEVTIRLWGKGVVLRRMAAGSEIAAERRLLVRANHFILSRIDARNGAMGLVPHELDGAVVSNDFPSYETDSSATLPEFVGWLSKTREFVDACRTASEGTTNRVRLQESKFLKLEIPLPPLSEQRRIVAKIERLAAKIDEAHKIHAISGTSHDALFASLIHRVISAIADELGAAEIGSLSPHVTSGPRSWSQFYSEKGLRFYRAQDIGPDGTVVDDSKQFISPPDGQQGRSAFVQRGDLFIVITGATVGRVALFNGSLEPGLVSQHVAICRLPSDQIQPEYALWALRCRRDRSNFLDNATARANLGLI